MNYKIKKIAENILGRDLTEKDGMSLTEIETIENSLNLSLPEELKSLYILIGNMEIFISSFESFIKPYIKGDKLVFLEENQGVCYWGIDIKHVNNRVVLMCTDIESNDPEWCSEEVNLSDFLIIILYYQCAQGGYEYGSAVYESKFENKEMYLQFLETITNGYEKVVEYNGLVIYQNEGKLIWHFMDDEDNLSDTIFASTRTKELQEELEKSGFQEL